MMWTGPRMRAPVHHLRQPSSDEEPLCRRAEDRRTAQARGLRGQCQGTPLVGKGLLAPSPGRVQVAGP
eukprot:1881253-Alexandrium_andersonii.AAC.1